MTKERMASLKALKMRITSVKSTQKITKAMKMVAAAKLRRAQEAAEAARPYSERMAAVMASLGSRVTVGPESPKLLAGTGKDQVHLLVIASSERGLAVVSTPTSRVWPARSWNRCSPRARPSSCCSSARRRARRSCGRTRS